MDIDIGDKEKLLIRQFSKSISLWLPIFLWAGFIFYLSSQPNLKITADTFWDLILRKLAHMVVFGILQLLLLRALGYKRWILASVITLLYAVSDEVHQSFVPTRYGTPSDLLYDGAGALLSLLIYKKVTRTT